MGTGLLILHGGGEAMPGDEPTALEALELASASRGAASRDGDEASPIEVAILPLAAARGRPALTVSHVTTFVATVARARGVDLRTMGVPISDRASAEEPAALAILGAADLIIWPGGDPDLLPTVLPGSGAWRAILEAHRRGAVIWGASAGAMALAEWCWTPAGGQRGLALVQGLVVAPHVEAGADRAWLRRLRERPAALGILTLAERTSLVGPLEERSEGAAQGSPWRCVGPGVAAWIPPGAETPIALAHHGERLHLPT